MVLLPILPLTLPPGICFSGPDAEQQRLVAFSEAQRAVLNGQSFYNIGTSVPAPENQGYPWFNTNDSRWYFFSGQWLSHHPIQSQDFVWMWSGSLVDLGTVDGGDAGAPSDRSGPMWEVVPGWEGRSPMHPGAIAGSDPAKVLAIDEDYGAGSIELDSTNMPPHEHPVEYASNDTGTGFPSVSTGSVLAHTFNTENAGGNGDTPPEADPFSLVHPVKGIYLVRRTTRIYYVA